MESAEKRGGQSGGHESYWQRTLKQLLRSAIDLSVLAADDVDLPSLYQIITSAPRSPEEASDAQWQKNSLCYALITHGKEPAEAKGKKTDWQMTRDFWLLEFPSLCQ